MEAKAREITMKTVTLLVLVALTHAQYYQTPDDNYNYADQPSEEFKQHLDCMLDKGPCSEMDGSQRKNGPEAIRSECAKCSTNLKRTFRIFLNRARDEFPEKFQEYKQKYDPENIHMDKLMAELNKH